MPFPITSMHIHFVADSVHYITMLSIVVFTG